jgi:hypothetical protein
LEEKLTHLAKKLSSAFDAYIATGEERHRYMYALLAVANFLEGIQLIEIYAYKFAGLAAALNDLDYGIVRPVLRAAHVENRTPDSTEVWLGRALVAVSLEALLMAGHTRKSAAEYIEKAYRSLSKLATKKATRLGTAAWGWHYEFRRDRVKNQSAQTLQTKIPSGARILDGLRAKNKGSARGLSQR